MQRDKVELNPNQPVTITLKYSTGREMPDRGYGPSYMYTTIDDRVLFVDPATSLAISRLEPQAGESITLCKVKRQGQQVHTTVALSVATERMRAAKEIAQMIPGELGQQMAGTMANLAEGKPPAAPRPSPMPPAVAQRLDSHPEPQQLGTGTNGPVAMPARALSNGQPITFLTALEGDTNGLVDVYARCLEHANQFGNRVKPEDVRSILQTVYIARTKNGASYAA
jgi:hypothetical protein